jgi:hypothetical protein
VLLLPVLRGFLFHGDVAVDPVDARSTSRAWTTTDRYLAELAGGLREPLQGLTAITNVRRFDSITGKVHPEATVFLHDGLITAVYDQAIAPPEGAAVIDGAGMMLLPALWDMHAHLGASDYLNYLSVGVTNVRDMANDPDYIMRTRRDAASGAIAAPDVYAMGFIDRRGEFAAPTGMLADTLDEALGFVDWYAQRGFQGIKLYSSIDPQWVAPIAAHAHELGLSVLGHIPSGMTAAQAIDAGFDEITHVNMILLNFLGAETIDTRTPQRFIVPIRDGGGLDVWSEEMSAFIRQMQANGFLASFQRGQVAGFALRRDAEPVVVDAVEPALVV